MLEGWASDVGLQEEATDYLRKLSSAADVIATPKVQLLQVSKTVAVCATQPKTSQTCCTEVVNFTDLFQIVKKLHQSSSSCHQSVKIRIPATCHYNLCEIICGKPVDNTFWSSICQQAC